MKVLVTGANGYIGQRILQQITSHSEHIIDVCVRSSSKFKNREGIRNVIEVDFLDELQVAKASFDEEYDVVFYLMHSMSHSKSQDFEDLEEKVAHHFVLLSERIHFKQVVYFSGIANAEKLSKHLRSRSKVAILLKSPNYPLTTVCAGIVVGSGSSSFEIIKDLVNKLPVMVTPRWLNTLTHPIGVKDLLFVLTYVMGNKECYDRQIEIGGKDVLSYKEMLLTYAEIKGVKRYIFTLPVMTPKLSSYWLYFVTSTNYNLATSLVDSMKIEVKSDNLFFKEIGYEPMTYREALERTLEVEASDNFISSWKDAYNGAAKLNVPQIDFSKKMYVDIKSRPISDVASVRKQVFSIGGEKGWYYGNFLWTLRGVLDKLLGGVGIRRGRTNKFKIHKGDALDFWRVADVDWETSYLLLYAEMILPGEAWLEFKVVEKNGASFLQQSAFFQPKGWLGKLYWFLVTPFHYFIFNGMIDKIISEANQKGSSHLANAK